jgi:hypothetical protein
LGLINQLGDAVLERIGSTLKEVLYENPLTEGVLDYQLFHESFREYLVKEKALKVNEASYRIIDFCSSWKDLQGQWEQRYALEHYAAHLFESKKEIHTEQLLKLICDSEFQTTQKKVLRGFEASNALFRLALLKASEVQRFDEQLEAGLCLVDLKYEEANDAPQIVAMVAAGEIDLALKRIESFGGADKEGMQRKFILYMLCLMELTLLDGKDKPFRKDAINILLNHFDEQIPPDKSMINWSDFFPSYLMFQMACEWAELEIDYSIVFNKTFELQLNWINSNGPYSALQFEVLIAINKSNNSNKLDSGVESEISFELARQGNIDKALSIAHDISFGHHRVMALIKIYSELKKLDNIAKAKIVKKLALSCARELNEGRKCSSLRIISDELSKQGELEEASLTLLEAIACANPVIHSFDDILQEVVEIASLLINQNNVKGALLFAQGWKNEMYLCRVLAHISTELAKIGLTDEANSLMQQALEIESGISNDYQRTIAIVKISSELLKQGSRERALLMIKKALSLTLVNGNERVKISSLMIISKEFAKYGEISEAKYCAIAIGNEKRMLKALVVISSELYNLGLYVESSEIIQEALELALGLDNSINMEMELEDLSIELARQGQLNLAMSSVRSFCNNDSMRRALIKIYPYFAVRGLEKEVHDCILEMSFGYDKSKTLLSIAEFQIERKNLFAVIEILNIALIALNLKEDNVFKCLALGFVSKEFFRIGKLIEANNLKKESLQVAKVIRDRYSRNSILINLSTAFAQQGNFPEAYEFSNEIKSVTTEGNRAYESIIFEIAKHGKFDEALEGVKRIKSNVWRSRLLILISSEFAKQGFSSEALNLRRESLAYAGKAKTAHSTNFINGLISQELASQGHIEEALSIARVIGDELQKCEVLCSISTELFLKCDLEFSSLVMEEALSCTILMDYVKRSLALTEIATELSRQGKVREAELVGLEIPRIGSRHNCWKNISKISYEEMGLQKSLQQNNQFKSDEARLFYLKGLANALNVSDTNSVCVQEALIQLAHDSESVESILQSHALHEIFFGAVDQKRFNRLNRTLNIQWALDIASQFPKAEKRSRLSSNLESWLHEIADEDDREQIELWAKQVAKGKISKEEFGERLSGLM